MLVHVIPTWKCLQLHHGNVLITIVYPYRWWLTPVCLPLKPSMSMNSSNVSWSDWNPARKVFRSTLDCVKWTVSTRSAVECIDEIAWCLSDTWLWSNHVPLKETAVYRFWIDSNRDILAYDCGILWLARNTSVITPAPCVEQALRPYVCKQSTFFDLFTELNLSNIFSCSDRSMLQQEWKLRKIWHMYQFTLVQCLPMSMSISLRWRSMRKM